MARLGARESGTARLEEAVAAYRAALTKPTRERVPYYWAQTQENLAIVLRVLATRVVGTARLAYLADALPLSLPLKGGEVIRCNDPSNPSQQA